MNNWPIKMLKTTCRCCGRAMKILWDTWRDPKTVGAEARRVCEHCDCEVEHAQAI